MGKKIVLEEKGSEFVIEDDLNTNPSYFRPENKYKFLANQEKCDYIVEINRNSNSKVLFIELKGTDFKKGMDQLENTVRQLQSNYRNWGKCCFYIGKNIPSAKTSLPRYKKSFSKLGAKLITKTGRCETKISLVLGCKCVCG